MKFLVFSLLNLTLTLSAFAVETKICLITTDIDSEQTELLIDTNSNGDLDTIRLYKTMDGKVISDDFHPAERAIIDGIVASERDGRQVVILKTKVFTATEGGVLALNYLYNGINGTRREFNLKLTKVNGKFVLSTPEGAKVNRLLFVGNRAAIINKFIGIKEIKASYK